MQHDVVVALSSEAANNSADLGDEGQAHVSFVTTLTKYIDRPITRDNRDGLPMQPK